VVGDGCCVAVQGLEAILRVRCSSGLDVEGYIGSFYKPPNSPTDLYMPAIDCDKALVAKLEIMEKLPANNEVRRRTCAQGCMA
jgi:protein transport protein SEC24